MNRFDFQEKAVAINDKHAPKNVGLCRITGEIYDELIALELAKYERLRKAAKPIAENGRYDVDLWAELRAALDDLEE